MQSQRGWLPRWQRVELVEHRLERMTRRQAKTRSGSALSARSSDESATHVMPDGQTMQARART